MSAKGQMSQIGYEFQPFLCIIWNANQITKIKLRAERKAGKMLKGMEKDTLNWERMDRLVKRWIPSPRVFHPYPEQRLAVIIRGRGPVR